MQKKYIVLISIFAIYTLIMVLFGAKKSLVPNNSYIIVGDSTIWEYEDEKWENIDVKDASLDSIEFYVYKDQTYQGKYYLQNYNDTWYFFDKNNQSYDLYGQLFAYSNDRKIDVVQFMKEEVSLNEVNEILKDYNITINSLNELSFSQKIAFDFDSDDQDEYIYSISNIMAEEQTLDEFSLVIYIDDGKKKDIMNKTSDVKYIYEISNIIDFNEDGLYEIIIEHQKPMNPSNNCHSMYELKNKKYELVKSCG